MTKPKDEYCVLRIPIQTREDLIEIANKQKFPPRWTDMANQILIDYIQENRG